MVFDLARTHASHEIVLDFANASKSLLKVTSHHFIFGGYASGDSDASVYTAGSKMPALVSNDGRRIKERGEEITTASKPLTISTGLKGSDGGATAKNIG